LAKLATAAALVVLGILPWMLWTGWFESIGRVPMARSYLRAGDYLLYLQGKQVELTAAAAVVAGCAAAGISRPRLPQRVVGILAGATAPGLFLVGWILAAYVGFQVLVPVASDSMTRLSHQLIAAPILFAAGALVVLRRVALQRVSGSATPAIAVIV